ncbi:tautomerase family protein [Ensifer sp. B1-9]|uniref:tautomerase family protein n=1 Tax=Ensifer sp. B1-9 TaxID=3141455 RepID=UPI003D1BF7A1
MPVIRVDWLAGRSQEQKQEVAEVFTRELSRIAKCSRDDVQIVFVDVERKNWAVGGVFSESQISNQ